MMKAALLELCGLKSEEIETIIGQSFQLLSIQMNAVSYDGSHLTKDSALEFSRKVVNEIVR